MKAFAIALLLVCVSPEAAFTRQAPKPAAPARPPAAAPAVPTDVTKSPDTTFTYQPDGRRDPFLNLLGMGGEDTTSKKGEGAAGLTVAEISVSGVLQSRGELIAMVQGPDKKTYIVRQGDKFLDGTIKSVTPQGLIIVQEVNDPLSLVKQREIRKLLRTLEDAKE